jgi:hypothetical protein
MPLTKWWVAARLFNQGKNRVSANEIHRQLGSAWFMVHRLREAMSGLEPGFMVNPPSLAAIAWLRPRHCTNRAMSRLAGPWAQR